VTRVRRFFEGFGSLIVGMGVTGKHFFRKPVTVRYPRQKPTMSAAFRSVIAFVRFEETGSHDCIACDACSKICPSDCIDVVGRANEGLKGKRAEKFEIDFSLCSLCGLCVDVCPTETLTYAKFYDHVGREREGFVYDLLEPYRADEPAYLERARAKAKAEAEAKAAAKAAREAKKAEGER
jgi:NADH-quinone oxidoreductase subunit I